MKKLFDWLISKTSTYKNLLRAHERLSKDFEDVFTKRATLRDIAVRNGTITVDAATESAALFASQFIHWLDELGAVNYLETTFKESIKEAAKHDREPLEVTVTVQRKDGKTPHQIRQELEEGLRDIASYLGVGGYNTEGLPPAELLDKVRDGIRMHEDSMIQLLQKTREGTANINSAA